MIREDLLKWGEAKDFVLEDFRESFQNVQATFRALNPDTTVGVIFGFDQQERTFTVALSAATEIIEEITFERGGDNLLPIAQNNSYVSGTISQLDSPEQLIEALEKALPIVVKLHESKFSRK